MTIALVILAAAVILLSIILWAAWPFIVHGLAMQQARTLTEREIAEPQHPVASGVHRLNGHVSLKPKAEPEKDPTP